MQLTKNSVQISLPAWNSSVDKRGIGSPTKWISMCKASSLYKPAFILHNIIKKISKIKQNKPGIKQNSRKKSTARLGCITNQQSLGIMENFSSNHSLQGQTKTSVESFQAQLMRVFKHLYRKYL